MILVRFKKCLVILSCVFFVDSRNSFQVITCVIGAAERKTLAKFHVNNPDQLVNLLLQLTSEQ